MKKIEKLTARQEKQLIEYREEWLQIERSTAPADRLTAERAIKTMYSLRGEKEPYVWWCDGPAVGSLARTVLRVNLGANLRDNLWDNLRDNLRANLRDNLWDNLRANLWDNLWANLGDNLRDNLWDNFDWGFWGSHEAYWSAYFNWPHTYLRDIYTNDQVAKLSLWLDLSKSCGWWHPFRGVVFVCERPEKQLVNARGRLHCLSGPAMKLRDGWELHTIHGVRVPSKIVEQPEAITTQEIDSEKNAEVRRIMIERYGFDRYVKDAGVRQIQQDDFGKLYRKEVAGEPAMQFVRVVNSTPEPDGSFKQYCLPVRNTVKTAHEAVASTFGMDTVSDYNPSFES